MNIVTKNNAASDMSLHTDSNR